MNRLGSISQRQRDHHSPAFSPGCFQLLSLGSPNAKGLTQSNCGSNRCLRCTLSPSPPRSILQPPWKVDTIILISQMCKHRLRSGGCPKSHVQLSAERHWDPGPCDSPAESAAVCLALHHQSLYYTCHCCPAATCLVPWPLAGPARLWD